MRLARIWKKCGVSSRREPTRRSVAASCPPKCLTKLCKFSANTALDKEQLENDLRSSAHYESHWAFSPGAVLMGWRAEKCRERRCVSGSVRHGSDPAGRERLASRLSHRHTSRDINCSAHGPGGWNAGRRNRGARREITFAIDPRRDFSSWALEKRIAILHGQRIGSHLKFSLCRGLPICAHRASRGENSCLRDSGLGCRVGSSPRVRRNSDSHSSAHFSEVGDKGGGNGIRHLARGCRYSLAWRFPRVGSHRTGNSFRDFPVGGSSVRHAGRSNTHSF